MQLSKHWNNLRYLTRHKWYVYKAGRKLGVGRYQLLIHDLSKFYPDEWFAYANHFFSHKLKDGSHRTGSDDAFDKAWLYHQKRNKHHWQFWVHIYDTSEVVCRATEMPRKYAQEMVADWMEPDCSR